MSGYEIVALALVMFSLGIFVGHAAGYGKGLQARAPRYRRTENE